jgi:hypothetical protein
MGAALPIEAPPTPASIGVRKCSRRGRKSGASGSIQNTAAQMEYFRQVQWAFKLMPGIVQRAFANAVKGTPLMPRDLFLMCISGRLAELQLEDGRRIYPMVAVKDVSNSLDMITQVVGSLLFRGEDGWQALIAPDEEGQILVSSDNPLAPAWRPVGMVNPSTSLNWTLLGKQIVGAATANILSPVLVGVSEVLVILQNITHNINAADVLRVSVNGGATFFSNAADYYITTRATGVPAGTTGGTFISLQATAARSSAIHIPQIKANGAPRAILPLDDDAAQNVFFTGNLVTDISRLQIVPSGGFVTAGTIYWLGR